MATREPLGAHTCVCDRIWSAPGGDKFASATTIYLYDAGLWETIKMAKRIRAGAGTKTGGRRKHTIRIRNTLKPPSRNQEKYLLKFNNFMNLEKDFFLFFRIREKAYDFYF
jgi:hypothetical protein